MGGSTDAVCSLPLSPPLRGGRSNRESWTTMTHARIWVGAVVVLGLPGALGLSESLDRGTGVAGADSAVKAVKKVKCDKGQTLTDALKKAKPGDTLQVTGTCQERVTITTDRLTLDGGGSAVLDGGEDGPTEFEGVVTIDGAHGVIIIGFTIQNSPRQGILGMGGAAFMVKDTTTQNNGLNGIFLNNNSSAELTDVEVKDNGRLGIAVFNNSTTVLKGHISSTGSGSNGSTASNSNGIAVQSGSMLEIRGAAVEASNNGGNGVDIIDSQAIIFGYPESQGSILTAHNNGGDGIFVATGSLSFFGEAVGLYTISASNNGGSRITIEIGGAVVSPFAAAKFIIENNQQNGLNVGGGGSALIIGGLTVQNNQIGLLANGAGTLTLFSVPPNPSSIENNSETDVDLKFGTRVTFQDVAIGSITCDATVLSRGSTVCP
jgi:Right handed beta helix region